MKHSYCIGIDCGTSNIKVVLFDLQGNEIADHTIFNQLHTTKEKSEQNMVELWDNVKICIQQMAKKVPKLIGQISSIGVSGQGEGLWCLDDNQIPIGNAILWNDNRAAQYLNSIKSDVNFYEELKKSLASYIKSGSTLTLLSFVKEYDPVYYSKIATIFSCKDWIRFKLTGNINWELSDASCSCIDFSTGEYAWDVFKELGLFELESKLPPLIKATDCAGYLLPEVAIELGLNENLPISGGMLDIVSAAAGCGAINKNDTCVILGTTGMTLSVMQSYRKDTLFNGWEYHIDGKQFIKGMGTMAATPNLDWAIKILFPNMDVQVVYANIEKEYVLRKPGDSGLVYHPHISISGERAPFFNTLATAQILGINSLTTQMDILHSIMEGVAFSIRDCLLSVSPLQSIYITGGGSKSDVWCQMIADIVNTEVYTTKSKELSAKGAALSAFLMSGVFSEFDAIPKSFFTLSKVFLPNKKTKSLYDELYIIYKNTQESIFDFWKDREIYLKRIENAEC